MADIQVGEKYKCSVCGKVVKVTKARGGTLKCCGKPMEKSGE
jgi:desulfoferrodoxin-like iron-binding protein